MKTLGELELAIANYLDREDLAAQIPDFISLAESKIYRGLRIRDNEFLYSLVTDPEEVVIPGQDPTVNPISPITLPANFRETKLLVINDRVVCSVTDQEFFRVLEMNLQYTDTVFTVMDRKLYLSPWPTSTPDEWDAIKIDLFYYGTESIYEMASWNTETNPVDEPPQVEASTSYDGQSEQNTTRLFQVAPDLYLYGALMEASMYLIADARVPMWEQKFSQTMLSLRAEDRRAQVAGSTTTVSSVYH